MRSGLLSLLTDTTCGEACWHAREEVCRCECGGKNHGCLRTKGGEQPVRACRIAGFRYELVAVGKFSDLYTKAQAINEAGGFSSVDARMPEHRYHYTHKETEDGSPARLKPASAAQVEKWAELTAWKGKNADRPYLLWKRTDAPAGEYCPDACERCAAHRAKWAAVVAGVSAVPITARTRTR